MAEKEEKSASSELAHEAPLGESEGKKAPASVIGADAALELLRETGGLRQPLDPDRSRKLLRRIDAHIMPLICIVYFLQYIDKTAISYASVTGIVRSTGLVGNDFNWVASIFFFGQLAFEFHTIRLIQIFPLAKYVSVNVTLWGVVLACLAAGKNFAGHLVCRFFLGALEAAIVPAWVLFTSQWYTKEEQAYRVGVWFSVCGAAQMFGGYFAYGVAVHVGADPTAALKGWQVIFLFLGLLTAWLGSRFGSSCRILPPSRVFSAPRRRHFILNVSAATSKSLDRKRSSGLMLRKLSPTQWLGFIPFGFLRQTYPTQLPLVLEIFS
jgi:MFS transporter, ACS family, allantoate permease